MVCIEEGCTECVIHDMMPCPQQKKMTLHLRSSYTVEKLFAHIRTQYSYDSFELILQACTNYDDVVLNYVEQTATLQEVGINFEKGARNILHIRPPSTSSSSASSSPPHQSERRVTTPLSFTTPTPPPSNPQSDDELALGASASPTEPDSSSCIPTAPPVLPLFDCGNLLSGIVKSALVKSYKIPSKPYTAPRATLGYVGLVNQAMTCYLNSLIQALFMTPEFRNGLYNWEFDGAGEIKSIPYQLQKLFVNLQTSEKLAVETKELTTSFGWDSTEAWQQHDIQELCRVMFDALEQKFKNTKQADLINRLYEGKMIDYVKCLDCSTEKSREDTFLDIPLPVRPFGSTVAYNSVEEALRAFVQPETLDGNNQYFCEKCNRKCDAHKGLKFSKFPYVLTLHLKRFDFDYQTLHRIKLNDKVTFPETLNLNSFVRHGDTPMETSPTSQTVVGSGGTELAPSEHESVESAVKCDDCSTTDSGSALEDESCNGAPSTAGSNSNEQDLQEDDEGIDMSTSTDNKSHPGNEGGPYFYELFAIMIHSGSASGGHYYAYIKDFESGEWYCFNDQTVTTITEDDIEKSFGGGAVKGYYSGAYSSSTNAYMLMYRQMDAVRNRLAIKPTEFPDHIKKLLQNLKDKEESDKKMKEQQDETIILRVNFTHPLTHRQSTITVYMLSNATFEETFRTVYEELKPTPYIPIERCRLVSYDHAIEGPGLSFDGQEETRIDDIVESLNRTAKRWMMETREENEQFEPYVAGSCVTRIFKVNVISGDIEALHSIRVDETSSIGSFKKVIAQRVAGLVKTNVVLAICSFNGNARLLTDDTATLASERIYQCSKIFTAAIPPNGDTKAEQLRLLAEKLEYVKTLYFAVPNTDKETLDKLSIPSYQPPLDTPTSCSTNLLPTSSAATATATATTIATVTASGVATASNKPVSPLNGVSRLTRPIGGYGDGVPERMSPLPLVDVESNSEDSSLSDGDRTLIEAAPDDLSRVSTPSHSPAGSDRRFDDYDMDPLLSDRPMSPEYFRAIVDNSKPGWYTETGEKQNVLKVFVDKTTTVSLLKRSLEPHIQVPSKYFKIFRLFGSTIDSQECTRLNENMSCFIDGERLRIELGRALGKDEHKCKLYFLKLSEVNDDAEKLPYLCDWIFRDGIDVAQTKREIIAYLSTIDAKYGKLTGDTCRLRKIKNVSKIYMDDEKFGDDIPLTSNSEMVIQELEATTQPLIDPDMRTLFIRRWNPSTMTLDSYNEITLDEKQDIRQVLSAVSGIPVDRVAFAKTNSFSFPRCTYNLMSIDSNQTWYTESITLLNRSLNNPQDGSIFFYKDTEEALKELTPEERRELAEKESTRIDQLSSTSTIYSPRRERALKIYYDSSPKKRDE